MSFATLEEAWGVPALGPVDRPTPSAERPNAAAPRAQRPVRRALDAKAPLRLDDDVDVQHARRLLASAYASYGIAGVARLLPPEAADSLSLYHRRRKGGWWRRVRRALTRPETLLFLLLCVFVMFVLWDSLGSRAPPALTAMPMATFSMGTATSA